MLLFIIKIKKETRGGLSVRVFLHRIGIKLKIGDVALAYNSPNYRREYRLELRTYPSPTPQESFLLLFFKKEEKPRVLLQANHLDALLAGVEDGIGGAAV